MKKLKEFYVVEYIGFTMHYYKQVKHGKSIVLGNSYTMLGKFNLN